MDESAILEVLLELAADAGMRVKIASRDASGPDSLPLASGVCRVRGELWVVLASSEPPSAQIGILVAALRKHAGSLLEERHLPPAVRGLLEDPGGARGR